MDRETTQQQRPLAVTTQNPWTLVLLALAVAGLYLALHPYLGITHDARLYTLQALNHLRPDLYGNDVFLRYGSQDDYTLFTRLHAVAIAWLGIEPAAAVLTFISHLAFLVAAGLLALRLMPARVAFAALALLLLLPSHYGSHKVFSYFEGFITPRLLAESLVLFGICAWLGKRHAISAALLACAMLTHPIMGLAGVALLATVTVVIPHWRRCWPVAALALLAVGAMALFGAAPAHWRLDDEWLGIVLGRAKYLSLANWSIDDWGRVAVVAASLFIAAWCLRGDLRRLAAGVLFSTGALMLLALIGGDLLRISIVVQAQPWRALWLATVIAILLLPSVLIQCWQDASLRRCGTILLAAAWLSPSENLGLLIAPLAVAAVYWHDRYTSQAKLRLLLLGSYAVLAIIVLSAIAVSLLAWQGGTYNISVSPVLDTLRGISTGGVVPLIILSAGYWVIRSTARPILPALAAALALLVVTISAPTLNTWLDVRYDSKLKAAFAEWRARIPPGSDVMWATDSSTGADSATSTWLLLERPSYVSQIQATTSLFSRQAALEIFRRTQSLAGVLPDIGLLSPNAAKIPLPKPLTLARVCRSASVRYIVTHALFVDATALHAPAQMRLPFRNLKLYICP